MVQIEYLMFWLDCDGGPGGFMFCIWTRLNFLVYKVDYLNISSLSKSLFYSSTLTARRSSTETPQKL